MGKLKGRILQEQQSSKNKVSRGNHAQTHYEVQQEENMHAKEMKSKAKVVYYLWKLRSES